MDTALRILQAAERLTGERGPSPSVAQIAAAAQVSRTTLYRHFGSKRALQSRLAAAYGPDHASTAERDTRKRILDAALYCFARAGFHGASMEAVAKQAGLSRAGVIWHFRRKEALLNALSQGFALPAPDPLWLPDHDSESETTYLHRLARTLYESLAARRDVLRVLLEASRHVRQARILERSISDMLMPTLGAFLQRRMEEGRYRRVPIAVAVQAFIAPILLLAVWPDFLIEPSTSDSQHVEGLHSLVQIYLDGIQHHVT